MILQKKKSIITVIITMFFVFSFNLLKAGAANDIDENREFITEDNEKNIDYNEETIKSSNDKTTVKERKNEYNVVFTDGEEELAALKLKFDENLKNIPQYDKNGNEILGWICNGSYYRDLTNEKCSGDAIYSVWKAPNKKSDEHIQYMSGIDGAFKPNEYITRAQFCVIFDRLYNLPNNSCGKEYKDILDNKWYSQGIYKVISCGMMNGYPDGNFEPERPMTRAEFVEVICKLYNITNSDLNFGDIESHWAKKEIKYAAKNGWINGYSDGTFRPDSFLTRAEACVIINRILGRSAWKSTDLIVESSIHPFYDVGNNDWFFNDIIEATVIHSYDIENNSERWTGFKYLPNGYYEGITALDNRFLYTDKNGQFVYLNANSFMTLNDKIYYVDNNSSIFISVGPSSINNDLYCFNADHSLLRNGFYGNLYFGDSGRYTCGSESLDELVKSALSMCINEDMTQSEKLRAAYLYIRDNYTYLNRPHHPRGASDFIAESAEFMFKNKKGNCYCFASCFFLMAQRLGFYDANVVSGGVGTTNSDHAWVMIYSKIYDVELEYAYMYRYANKHNYNLYNMTVGKTPFVYYFPY